MKLLDHILEKLGHAQLDPDLQALELELAEYADAIGGCVGFLEGVGFADPCLRPAPAPDQSNPLVAAFIADFTRAGFRTDLFEPAHRQRIAALLTPSQGYLGWLFTSRTFLDELTGLQESHPDAFRGVPPQGIALQAQMGLGWNGKLKLAQDHAAEAVCSFCRRWRLTAVRGPATVVPLAVQFPVPLPLLANAHAQSSGAMLFIPDIAPLPDRDDLRTLLEQTVRQTAADAGHLQEWIELVRSDTQGKKRIDTYARWFPVQHYLRVLYSRHAPQLKQCFGKIERALADFVDVSRDTLRRDLRQICQRLGRGWYLPGSPLQGQR
jgi:hypothetical protein